MGVWDNYKARADVHGHTVRDAIKKEEIGVLNRKVPQSLSYHHAVIDGEDRYLAIINSDNLNEKTLCTLPGEKVPHGGIVEWMDERWLITELDANSEIYTRAKMQQCNYLLRWVNTSGDIIERWCIVEDGTKLKYDASRTIVWRIRKRYARTIP